MDYIIEALRELKTLRTTSKANSKQTIHQSINEKITRRNKRIINESLLTPIDWSLEIAYWGGGYGSPDEIKQINIKANSLKEGIREFWENLGFFYNDNEFEEIYQKKFGNFETEAKILKAFVDDVTDMNDDGTNFIIWWEDSNGNLLLDNSDVYYEDETDEDDWYEDDEDFDESLKKHKQFCKEGFISRRNYNSKIS